MPSASAASTSYRWIPLPIGEYLFDGGSVADTSGRGNDFGVNADVSPVVGRHSAANSAVGFDAGEVLETEALEEYALSETGTLSYSVWFRATSRGKGPAIVDFMHDDLEYSLFLCFGDWSGGKPNILSACTGVCDIGTIPTFQRTIADDAWHHAAYIYKNKACSFYLDGELAGTGTYPYSGAAPSNGILRLGGYEDGDSFEGAIDDLRVYAIALSAEQVEALYGE